MKTTPFAIIHACYRHLVNLPPDWFEKLKLTLKQPDGWSNPRCHALMAVDPSDPTYFALCILYRQVIVEHVPLAQWTWTSKHIMSPHLPKGSPVTEKWIQAGEIYVCNIPVPGGANGLEFLNDESCLLPAVKPLILTQIHQMVRVAYQYYLKPMAALGLTSDHPTPEPPPIQ